ncbi:MAG: alpha amylase C-terminal domain-containing protein [Oscillospiraceae bacterium]|nr:alpha amylase C-terminal domain-containing protein [Oscillospiraceae bacterium]
MIQKITSIDPSLQHFESDLQLRMDKYVQTKNALLQPGQSLNDFANAHLYLGIHRTEDGWVYREWAPAADEMYFTGDFNGWDRRSCPMTRVDNGIFEVRLPGPDALQNGQKVSAIVISGDRELDRIPAYANYVVQDPNDHQWNASIYTSSPFRWTDSGFKPQKNLFIYECHIGMAQEDGKVSTYREFREHNLKRIKALGYNTIQIMAIMEHPYYASFGYQVTNFFAPSSKFGTPDDLKELVNAAHAMGITVLLDVVHSHAAPNTREGINEFDGSDHQYFHAGAKGNHSAWGTKCFNYGKPEVLHFLLSNLKYWQTEFHFDGFRFDGVTSMLYHDHGLGVAFSDQKQYFSMNTDLEAVTYLQLANELVRQVNPNAITIAEDTSALPGLALPLEVGGVGFDYRLAMGEPDMWIRLLKETPDEYWNLNNIYYELAIRRPQERVIGYVESHDQALVGDKTVMFRMCDQEMYWGMDKSYRSFTVDRAMALHKMLRLLTMSLGGEGYLTFMGNEFGHPEWIDFPREGNGWSYHYCRRQWSLADNPNLKYEFLNTFDRDMVSMAKKQKVLSGHDRQLLIHEDDKVMVYKKGGALFAYNFHCTKSFDGYYIPVPGPGNYQVIMSTDDFCYGGDGRIYHQCYTATKGEDGTYGFRIYLPSRTAVVFRKVK